MHFIMGWGRYKVDTNVQQLLTNFLFVRSLVHLLSCHMVHFLCTTPKEGPKTHFNRPQHSHVAHLEQLNSFIAHSSWGTELLTKNFHFSSLEITT